MKIINENRAIVVNGSGINLDYYKNSPLPDNNIFLFVGRLLKDKGVLEYIEAAKIVKKKYRDTGFLLIGPYGSNPLAISKKLFKELISDGIIEHIEWVNDLRAYYKKCTVFVLPSYHEGMPHSVLEAMATGRPIITTEVPGCRETVIEGVNGFLVPARDINALVNKMIWMIENRRELKKMGQESISICRSKFDVTKVNKLIIDTMDI
jgi:glycosyltransferase involved in cell wall biosynthesis